MSSDDQNLHQTGDGLPGDETVVEYAVSDDGECDGDYEPDEEYEEVYYHTE
jgi:hypothetical protein